ncbi:uncharacterized protein LOC119295864 [Triticum dicoccoides]|uniref:uncharacterized protein LOC119295864 n=1 Tax=Triticum dicoccoides TaxID=85692 RepID=UPI00188E54DB|nr:uncharacterized protein LOC119295864 [Triticum dicoccoides]
MCGSSRARGSRRRRGAAACRWGELEARWPRRGEHEASELLCSLLKNRGSSRFMAMYKTASRRHKRFWRRGSGNRPERGGSSQPASVPGNGGGRQSSGAELSHPWRTVHGAQRERLERGGKTQASFQSIRARVVLVARHKGIHKSLLVPLFIQEAPSSVISCIKDMKIYISLGAQCQPYDIMALGICEELYSAYTSAIRKG